MRTFLSVLFVGSLLTGLAGCGGSDDALNVIVPPEEEVIVVDPTVEPAPVVAKLTLLTSIPQIPSDGALPATITAQVQDAGNNFLPDVEVSFSASSGGLTGGAQITDISGRAISTLDTAGDPTNRTITVTGTAANEDGTVLTDTVDIAVIGSQLTLTGTSSIALGDTQTYTVVLSDANGNGINGQAVTVSSSAGNTLSATSLTTDASGQAQFTLNATRSGSDNVSAQSLGLTATRVVTVSNDTFAFVTPAANTEIDLNVDRTVTVRWTQGGTPVQGQVIQLSTTRGILTPISDETNSDGEVEVTISSTNAGAATITASTTGGPTTSVPVEFVAKVADTIEVQADPFNVAPSEQATITAIVRDPNNNLVKNKTVVFILDDVSGGQLSVGQAVTDSQGRAQTFYTASSSTSASEGVTITAFVSDDPAVTDSIAMTVARRELFLAFGTGNSLEEPNFSQYEMEFSVQVTDADGNGVAGVGVQLSLLSTRYLKGLWVADLLANSWFTNIRATCDDEDVNRNGVLDMGEDYNNSGFLEAGNVATVTPGSGTTDENGFIIVKVIYPQVYAQFLEVVMEGKTDVQGTEFTKSVTFILPVLSTDVNTLDTSPPGILAAPDPVVEHELEFGGLVSPFGYSFTCGDTI